MKILVNVSVPAILKEFDMLIPDYMMIKDITSLIVEAIAERTASEYQTSKEEVLCYKEKNIVLNLDSTLKSSGVRNGDTIIVI